MGIPINTLRSLSNSQGIQRAESKPAFGIWSEQPRTEKEKEEEERRKSSRVAGFFNSALDWYDKIDISVADKLGLVDKIPEWKGPVDEILRAGLREGTRISTPLIALGGLGAATKLGSLGARAGARAAATQGARSAAFRGAQGAAKTGKMLVEPIASARGVSMPVRFAAETGMVAGAGMAGRGISETIPESAPTWYKVAAPLSVGLLGGVGGAKASMKAMKTLGINVDNSKYIAKARDERQNYLLRKRAEDARKQRVELLPDEERAIAEIGPFPQPEITDIDIRDEILSGGLNRKRALSGNIETLEELIQGKNIERFDEEYVRNYKDYEKLAYELKRNKYPVVGREIGPDGRPEIKWKNWDDTSAFLGGKETAGLIASKYEMRAMAAAGYSSAKDSYFDALMSGGKNDEFKIEIDGKKYSLDDMLDKRTGKLNPLLREEGILKIEKGTGLWKWDKVKGQPFREVISRIRKELDIQLEAEKQSGIDVRSITDETFADMPQEVIDLSVSRYNPEEGVAFNPEHMPYFGDVVERMDEARGYFPRFVVEGFGDGVRGKNSMSARSFGNKAFEKERKVGFSDGAEYQRQMWEVAESRQKGKGNTDDLVLEIDEVTGEVISSPRGQQAVEQIEQFYMQPRQALALRLKSGLDRINAQWFKDELTSGKVKDIGGETLLERLELNPEWGAARQDYITQNNALRNLTKKLANIDVNGRNLFKTRTARGQLNAEIDKNIALVLKHQTVNAETLYGQLEQLNTDLYKASGKKRRQKWTNPKTGVIEYKEFTPNKARRTAIRAAQKELKPYLKGDMDNYKAIRNNPQKIIKLLEEANHQVNAGVDQYANAIKTNPKYASEFVEGTIPPRTRAMQFDQAARQIQEYQLLSDKLLNERLEALSTALRNQENSLRRTESARSYDQTIADIRKQRVLLDEATAKYNAAKEEAQQVGETTGTLDNLTFSGRTFEGEFSDEINRYLKVADDTGIGGLVRKFNNFARPLMATLDFSAIGIQGLLAIGMDPIGSAKMIAISSYALKNPRFYDRFIVDHAEMIDSFIKDGGYWAKLDDMGEFMFKGGVTNLPVIGKGAKWSNHHFSRTGNLLRLQMYKNATQNRGAFKKLGLQGQMSGKDIATREDMIQSINEATGFKAGVPSDLGTAIFFAPRYFNSQLSILKKAAYKDGPDGALARDMIVRTMAVMSLATWGLNEMNGEETDWSPIRYDMEGKPHWDSNFMRVRTQGQDVSLFGSWDSLLALFGTAVTEGPTSAATRLARTKASPSMGRLFDLIMEETFTGGEVNFRTSDPRVIGLSFWNLMRQQAPFTVQDLMNEVAQDPEFSISDPSTYTRPSVLAVGSNITGIKSAPVTAYERRDDRSQQLYGRDWKELTSTEKNEVEAEFPEIIRAIDARNQTLADRGDMDAILRVNATKAEATAAEESRELAILVESGQIPREEFGKQFRNIKHDLAVTKQAYYNAAGIDYAESEDPVLRAVGRYYDIVNDPSLLIGNIRNWDKIDERVFVLRESLAPDEQTRFDQFFDLNYGQWPKELHEFIRMDNYVNKETEYWDQLDLAFDKRKTVLSGIASARGLDPINTYDELVTAINTATSQGELNVLTAQLKIIDKESARLRKQLRRLDPDLDVALYITRGLVPVTPQGKLMARSKRKF